MKGCADGCAWRRATPSCCCGGGPCVATGAGSGLRRGDLGLKADAPDMQVVSSTGEEVFFKIKRNTKLSKLQGAYANKVGKDVSSIRCVVFLFSRSILSPCSSATLGARKTVTAPSPYPSTPPPSLTVVKRGAPLRATYHSSRSCLMSKSDPHAASSTRVAEYRTMTHQARSTWRITVRDTPVMPIEEVAH